MRIGRHEEGLEDRKKLLTVNLSLGCGMLLDSSARSATEASP